MRQSKSGFTLIETLVVLSIIAFIFTFGHLTFKTVIEQQEEKQFWAKFDDDWKRYEQFANSEGVVTYITFDKSKRKIRFNPLKTFNKENSEISLPKTLSLFSNQEVKIGSDGYVKPQTIAFQSEVNKCTYRLTIQLGWGVYHVNRE
ncbi:competence type IV pilus minor pilin ComGD [Pediococcus ethanolidurans]|uniref:competence type IV pilus minor pilin ComGD n=1 Tax=Pediococcus ethanolidurans TaxID=319653 RepID=UPI001C1EB95D|nr:competence type IV pilus minor pilin ComGD [Pediococcus ethanolidurans]MBU7555617.1 type II secretion system protein [Pediococcus ethanolidurans]MBU7564338.1 type II secretion system protein [Pediococcus ethanolidurans]MCT4398676.1 type II secretion system protein [Pediococcus ethanolidurans]MCV3316240.1 competence type IV pilus minor pilin ComGD [Pediococcus ethanolidurans]MCV3322288.1 competence type IV pilus minor pilin ComGD [Pediococcus ethanolidurans]